MSLADVIEVLLGKMVCQPWVVPVPVSQRHMSNSMFQDRWRLFHQKSERLNVTKRSLSVKRVQLLSNKASAKGDSHIILTLFGLCEGAGLLRTRDDQVIHILLILIHILLILILYQTC